MWIVKFRNYKLFLKKRLKDFPKNGRGQSRRLAEHLNVAPIIISQVLSGDRHFTPDQAIKVARFFSMDERTTDYFVYQVNAARADSKELKAFYEAKMAKLRMEAQELKNVVIPADELSESDKVEYYSNWYYPAIFLISSIEGFQTVEAIAEYFNLSREKVSTVVAFLLRAGLCVEDRGKIRMGQKSVFVDSKSIFVNTHRRNWRDKAINRFSEPHKGDIFYSGPVSISKNDAEAFGQELLKVIQQFSKMVGPSKAEVLACLNVDWFHF